MASIDLPSSNRDNKLLFKKMVADKTKDLKTIADVKIRERELKEEIDDDAQTSAFQENLIGLMARTFMAIQGTTMNLKNVDELKKEVEKPKPKKKKTLIDKLKKQVDSINPFTISGLGIKEKQSLEKWKAITDRASSFTNKISGVVSSVGSYATTRLQSLMTGIIDIASCLGKFLLGPFKAGFKIADKLMYFSLGPAWTAVKNAVGSIGKIAKWVIGTGWQAISLIGDGIKALLSFPYDALKTTGTWVLKGTKAFFGWYFKNLFTTLFSPSMWIINIPIFVGITYAMFRVFETAFDLVSGPIYQTMKNLFNKATDKLADFTEWLWAGVKEGFNWIINVHIGKNNIKEYLSDFSDRVKVMLSQWFGPSTLLGDTIKWVKSAYTWTKDVFDKWYDSSASVFSSIVKYVKEMPGKTLAAKLVNKLENFKISFLGYEVTATSLFPFLKNSVNTLKRKYGFVMYGQGDAVSKTLELEKQKVLTAALEREIVSMQQQGMSKESIAKTVDETILPKLQQTIFGKISSEAISESKMQAYSGASDVISGRKGLVGDDVFNKRISSIQTLTEQLSAINSGIVEYNDETSNRIKSTLDYIKVIDNTETASRLKNAGYVFDKDYSDSTIDQLASVSNELDKMKLSPSYRDFLDADPLDANSRTAIGLAKLSSNISGLGVAAMRVLPIGVLRKITYGAALTAVSAVGQETLGNVYDSGQFSNNAGITSTLNQGNLSSISGPGGKLKTDDLIGNMMHQYFDEYGNFPGNAQVKSQVRRDLADLLQVPYVEDDDQRHKLVGKKYIDADYDHLITTNINDENLRVRLTNSIDQLLNSAASMNKTKKMATGGILPKDLSKILPLDVQGKEFIRMHVDAITKQNQTALEASNKKEPRSITNIIEENVYSESYEIYTLHHLSRGTLGAT